MAATAQSTDTLWHHKKCAVVLTYDDAISQHLDNAFPVLDSLQLKASFYLTAYAVKGRVSDWKQVAAKGYELGNHTLFHPCIGGAGREWLNPDYDMNGYTMGRMMDEIRMANVFLEAMDGKKQRTYAYTCGDMTIKDSSFKNLLKNDFVAARGVRSEMHPIGEVDLFNTDCFVVNGESATDMEEWVKQAMATHSLLVILFHGVGGGNGLNVTIPDHSAFLHYLKDHESDIWIAPMVEVATYINNYQQRQP